MTIRRQTVEHPFGTLKVNGYAGYRGLAQKNSVRLAFCWAHVRRRFY